MDSVWNFTELEHTFIRPYNYWLGSEFLIQEMNQIDYYLYIRCTKWEYFYTLKITELQYNVFTLPHPRGWIPHSQELSNNPYPELNFLALTRISLRSILTLSSYLHLGLPIGLFAVGLPVKILKGLLPSSILATSTAHLNLLDLITHFYINSQ